MATTTRLITAEEFETYPASRWCELIDGVPVEMTPPGVDATEVSATIVFLLSAHVRPRGLGRVLNDVGVVVRHNPDTVRAPDAAFIRADRLPAGRGPLGYLQFAPDLIVEVVSPSDRAREIQVKTREWLEAGARLIWIVYPASRTVEVIRSLQNREVLAADDTLDGGDVIPGFSCLVSELFT